MIDGAVDRGVVQRSAAHATGGSTPRTARISSKLAATPASSVKWVATAQGDSAGIATRIKVSLPPGMRAPPSPMITPAAKCRSPAHGPGERSESLPHCHHDPVMPARRAAANSPSDAGGGMPASNQESDSRRKNPV